MKLLGLFSLLLVNVLDAQKVIPHEPMSVVNSFLVPPSKEQLTPWQPLMDSRGHERERLIRDMNENLEHLVTSKAFVLALEGDPIVEYFPTDMLWNTTHIVPNPNVVTFISTSLSILLEGYEPDVLIKPLGILAKEKGVTIPERYSSKTLTDLLTKLPEEYETNTKSFLVEYNNQGFTALNIINSLLGKSLKDAWHDAFMSLQLDSTVVTDKRNILAPFSDLYRFTEVVLSDLKTFSSFPIEELPYDVSVHYVFGWWLNSNLDGTRLLDAIPSDAIFSFSSTMQIFVVPSLNMAAVVVNNPATSWNDKTMDEILFAVNEIWRQLLYAVNPAEKVVRQKQTEREEKKREEKREDNVKKGKEEEGYKSDEDLVTIILYWLLFPFKTIWKYFSLYLQFAASQHFVIRILLWVVFIITGHVWVYWCFHIIWYIITLFSSRAHLPRPKSKGD